MPSPALQAHQEQISPQRGPGTFTSLADPCPLPTSFLPTFCLLSLLRAKLCGRARRIQIAEAVIFVTPLPGSFLSCPLTFVKVKGILPRRLSACYLGWNQLPELHEEYFMQILRCALDGSSVTDPLPVPRGFIPPTSPDSPHASGVRTRLAADGVISEGGRKTSWIRQAAAPAAKKIPPLNVRAERGERRNKQEAPW